MRWSRPSRGAIVSTNNSPFQPISIERVPRYPAYIYWLWYNRVFALCTNPPLAAMISGCLVVVPILGSGMKLLVHFY